MTQKEIKKKQKRIADIWEKIDKRFGGELIVDDIQELVDLEIELTALDGQ